MESSDIYRSRILVLSLSTIHHHPDIDFWTFLLSTTVIPGPLGALHRLGQPLPAVEDLGRLRRRVAHEHAHGLYVEVAAQISLAERPAALAEIEIDTQVLLDDV